MEAWNGRGRAGHDGNPERVILPPPPKLMSGAGESSLEAIDMRASKWSYSGFRVESREDARLGDERSRGYYGLEYLRMWKSALARVQA